LSKDNNDKDFEKIFSEMVNSEDLKDIKEEFEANIKMGIKELALIQQSLSDVISHVAEIMMSALTGDNIFEDDNIFHNLLSSLYKISEDFNECMLEYYSEDLLDDEELGGEDD
jgi:hypothetical protein